MSISDFFSMILPLGDAFVASLYEISIETATFFIQQMHGRTFFNCQRSIASALFQDMPLTV